MKLARPMLRAVYTMLRSMPPFNRWKLPPAHEVKFEIISARHSHDGWYSAEYEEHEMRVSRSVDTLPKLVAVIAHEMAHMWQDRHGPSRKGWKDPDFGHGPDFKKIADRVCEKLGFNRRGF